MPNARKPKRGRKDDDKPVRRIKARPSIVFDAPLSSRTNLKEHLA
jgi:hypothetical protein